MSNLDLIIVIFITVMIILYLINNSTKKISNKISNKISEKIEIKKRNPQKLVKKFETKVYESNKIVILKNNWVEFIRSDVYKYRSIIDLLFELEINKISYSILLNCFEWQFKRLKILYRDKFECVDCGKKSDNLHVHHLYYIRNEMPWEIDDEGLVSLCKNCHTKRHEVENIFIYKRVLEKLVLDNESISRCPRCFGTGYLPHFHHVENGICFLCLGSVINKTVFTQRLKYILENSNTYNFNETFDQFNNFITLISSEYYYSNIHGKLYDEVSEFFRTENTILYNPGKSELLDFLMESKGKFSNKVEIHTNKNTVEEYDLPF